jgi:hypothetical protein
MMASVSSFLAHNSLIDMPACVEMRGTNDKSMDGDEADECIVWSYI